MRNLRTFGAVLAAATFAVYTGAVVFAGGGTAYYTGQGFTFDGTNWTLNDQRCGAEGQGLANDGGTGQFANWNGAGQPYQAGQPYLVWVLTVNAANPAATLHLPDGDHVMFKVGGTLKYASQYFSYGELVANPPIVSADYTYSGRLQGNPQLVVSHGCPSFNDDEGVWCSPGFWKNAQDGAWTLIGHSKTEFFNATVVPNFYDTASGADPTLETVLNTPGANTFGAASGPFGLNAFNATGAYLTDQIPGFSFSLAAYLAAQKPPVGNEVESCPIDHHGNFILPE